MLARNSKSFAAIAIAFVVMANGWHLGMLQLFAWSNMAIENAETMTYDEAILSALNGTEICGICEIVIKAESADGDHEFRAIEIKTQSPLILIESSWSVIRTDTRVGSISLERTPPDNWQTPPNAPPPRNSTLA